MSDDTKLLFIKIAWSKANCESYACDDRDDEDGDRSVSHLRWPRAVARVSRRRAHDPRRTCLVCVVSLSPSPVRLSAPRSLGSRGASARSVYNTKAECLSVSKVSPKFARRHGFNTNSWGLSRTAMHSTYRPGKKATHEHAQHVEEEPVQPADYRAVRVIEIERATIRSWPLPRRRLIARGLARSVV